MRKLNIKSQNNLEIRKLIPSVSFLRLRKRTLSEDMHFAFPTADFQKFTKKYYFTTKSEITAGCLHRISDCQSINEFQRLERLSKFKDAKRLEHTGAYCRGPLPFSCISLPISSNLFSMFQVQYTILSMTIFQCMTDWQDHHEFHNGRSLWNFNFRIPQRTLVTRVTLRAKDFEQSEDLAKSPCQELS